MQIILENVSAGYDKNNMILKDISVTFDEGGICGILGPNGSGKTTLLRVLSGQLSYSGNVQYGDHHPVQPKLLARYIAVTPQISSVYFSYTVYETVMMGRYAHSSSFLDSIKGPSSEDRDVVRESLEMTGITDIADKHLNELSGGQLQRVMLARTFAQKTPIILLDEPTNHLDIKYHVELMDYLKKWVKGSTPVDGIEHKNTAISVFHDIGDAAMVSDTILLMKDGQLIKKGPVSETLTRDLLKDVFETDVVEYYKLSRKILS